MLSTSSGGIGLAASGARAPRRESALVTWLDGFLSEELRQAPLEERGRGRVVAGAVCSSILMAAVILVAIHLAKLPGGYLVAAIGTPVGCAGALLVLRKASSARPAALLFCSIMASAFILLCLYEDDSYLATHVIGMMITVLAVYLLGPRRGLVIFVPLLLFIGVILPIYRGSSGYEPRPLTEGHAWVLHILAALSLLASWAIGWLYTSARDATQAELEQDIQARREAEAKLGELHRTLLSVSHQAGMAEIATGVLHNVGNTLNSVNVSVGLVIERLRSSRLSKLALATELMHQQSADLGTFLSADPRGKLLPEYLSTLSAELIAEREALVTEMQRLSESVDHIKAVVSMQQRHAKLGGMVEQVPVPQLISDAMRLHATSFERLGIEVQCEYAEVPPILVDRHKLLQILLNLVSNAQHSLVQSGTPDKRLAIRVGLRAGGEALRIEVADNGVGIAPEHLPRLFTQGFTTKKTGHGFGLHISALAAAEMKGRLTVASAGPGQGATFAIELPVDGETTLPPGPSVE
ncbi:HAMP domain-containing sensor histidine kinase [Hyalangium sp.]|uniref:sensor histidine kinase n=1 Tax=Hyalangium sp. TaxID=2028555 RepID=UPI002D244DF0|nr:HAMP domain-containing sensor histidine kinase [Hyalangium sp.]HYH97646.1 HAMP domain-containing sensor histidine kinase [Hyalangium sp.]